MSSSLKRTMVVTSDTENLHRVREFVASALRATPIPHEEQGRVVLAVDEAVANVIGHAYLGTAGGSVSVDVEVDGRRFAVVIRDSGRPFDPTLIKTPDMAEHVRAGRKNGLGVFLIRKIMDEVSYEFHDQGNQLTLVKHVR